MFLEGIEYFLKVGDTNAKDRGGNIKILIIIAKNYCVFNLEILQH